MRPEEEDVQRDKCHMAVHRRTDDGSFSDKLSSEIRRILQ